MIRYLDVGHDCLYAVVVADDSNSIAYAVAIVLDFRLYLSQFDAEAVYLHLKVRTTMKNKVTVGKPCRNIAALV